MAVANSSAHNYLSRTLLLGLAAFACYLSMYAFRKPFVAGTYESGILLLGLELKTLFVLSQLVGYTLSKYIGTWWLTSKIAGNRFGLLIRLMLIAYLSLWAFYLLPTDAKAVAMLVNGLPLGMVWGIVVSYLEGRRNSDTLLVILAGSLIVASSITKDSGLWLMNNLSIDDYLMPVAVATLFFPLLIFSAWWLERSPPPDQADVEDRTIRTAMDAQSRTLFIKQYWPGLLTLITAFVALTAYRDFRDNFGIEIIIDLGYAPQSGIFSLIDLPVAVVVLASLLIIQRIKNHRESLLVLHALMIIGGVALIGSTVLMQMGVLSGMAWLILGGIGSFVAYIGYNTLLYERLMSHLKFPGTAIFAIYLSDAAGYSGSLILQIYKDLFADDVSRLEFFVAMNYGLGMLISIALIHSASYFLSNGREKLRTD